MEMVEQGVRFFGRVGVSHGHSSSSWVATGLRHSGWVPRPAVDAPLTPRPGPERAPNPTPARPSTAHQWRHDLHGRILCRGAPPSCPRLRRVDLDLQTASIQESIADFDSNVTAIADLHARSMNALSEQDSAANHARLAELTEATRALSNALSKRIQALKVQPAGAGAQDTEIRKNRVRLRCPDHNDVTATPIHCRSLWCTASLSRPSRGTRTSSSSIARGTRTVWNGSSGSVIPFLGPVASRFNSTLARSQTRCNCRRDICHRE